MHLTHLNEAQRRAIKTIKGRVLILAGAGSGKTSVLTYRIAHLVKDHNISPSNILGLTFTNKAAEEMRQRVANMLDPSIAKQLTLCTFHSFCMQILRQEIYRLGYTTNFTLYDEKDIKRLLSQMARLTLEHEGEIPSLESTFAKISQARMQGTALESGSNATWHDQFAKQLHERLDGCLRAYNAVDFDGLLTLTVQLFEEFPEVLRTYQERFLYIMIDEYQDTNPIQYRLASLLSKRHNNLCVVGDDDQSIYGWRGAAIEHILHFEADAIIKLEQNYRSTPTILKAANAVICNNRTRHDKQLWSTAPEGDLIELFHAPSETDEALSIVQRMIRLKEERKIPWRDMAVLYRSNQLSKPIEMALLQATWRQENQWIRGIPYQIFGGTELFERSEIKDLTAYLKVLSNPLDEESILRIINVPRRGISDQALDKITQHNRSKKLPLWKLLQDLTARDPTTTTLVKELSEKALKGADLFVHLILKYQKAFTSDPIHKALERFVEEINYRKAIEEEVKSDTMRSFKWENIEGYIAALKQFKEGQGTLADFLSSTLLDQTTWSNQHRELSENKVNLMTFHSAKGLEFTACFLMGLEDHIMPHEKSVKEGSFEEERRLMYVAITRAKRYLCLSMARQRKQMGREKECSPSRFLFEIPKEVLNLTSCKLG
ncbi:MAG: UvrD-helicase domain-containing protein [Anaplasmataceae bacterium]|nr:UvrD-helicase domain-containing protein [Anaplasmataceae bacterium]